MKSMKPLTKAEQKELHKLMERKEATETDFRIFLRGYDANAINVTPAPVDPVQVILDERGSRYGDFTDHARLAQQLQACLREHKIPNMCIGGIPTYHQPYLSLDSVKKQALIVITDKLARILNGDPNYADNWVDIQGYARLVEERLKQISESGAVNSTPAS